MVLSEDKLGFGLLLLDVLVAGVQDGRLLELKVRVRFRIVSMVVPEVLVFAIGLQIVLVLVDIVAEVAVVLLGARLQGDQAHQEGAQVGLLAADVLQVFDQHWVRWLQKVRRRVLHRRSINLLLL